MQIPIVDIAEIGLLNHNEPPREALARVAKEVDSALSMIGFVYLKNHGIDKEKIEDVNSASAKFFALPLEVKRKYDNDETHKHGYTMQDREILHNTSNHEIREAFDIGILDGRIPEDRITDMKPAVLEIASLCCKLTMRLLKVLGIALQLKDDDYFRKCHQKMFSYDNGTSIRILNYPPIVGPVKPGTVRCGEHSDYGTLTLLFQDEVGGLEVKNVDGTWIPANPIPDTILINVGDLLQIWSGGRYPATIHRVLVPENTARKQTARRVLTCFVHPSNDTVVAPLVGSYCKAVHAGNYLMKRFEETYQ